MGGETEEEKVDRLIAAIEDLKQQVGIPASIKDATAVGEGEFMAKVDDVAEQAFDDQCTGSNPRYPLISDLRQLLIDAYRGDLAVSVSASGNGNGVVQEGAVEEPVVVEKV